MPRLQSGENLPHSSRTETYKKTAPSNIYTLYCGILSYFCGIYYHLQKMASRAAQIAGHLNWPQGMLAGQVAIITGSGQGIGAEAARLFANEGAKVIVQDIDAGKALQARRNVASIDLQQPRHKQPPMRSSKAVVKPSQFQETCSIPNTSRSS